MGGRKGCSQLEGYDDANSMGDSRCILHSSVDSTHKINVANVDPEKGTYAVGDFKTVALAGYIRAKVRSVSFSQWTGCSIEGGPCLIGN